MIHYRVSTLTRHHDGTDHATLHGPFVNRAEAYRFAAELRDEDRAATVDVIAIGDRGEYVPDTGPPDHRTPTADEAAVQAMTAAITAGVDPRPLPPRVVRSAV